MDAEEFKKAWGTTDTEATPDLAKPIENERKLPPLASAQPPSGLKAEKIVFRVWSLNDSDSKRDSEKVLRPVNSLHNHAWQRLNYATCAIDDSHTAPETGCICGIYGFHALEDALHYANLWQVENLKKKYRGFTESDYRLLNKEIEENRFADNKFVLGVVRLKGKMFFDKTAYRSETGEILGLFDYSLLSKIQKATSRLDLFDKENHISEETLAEIANVMCIPVLKDIDQLGRTFDTTGLALKEESSGNVISKFLSSPAISSANEATDFFFQSHILSDFDKEEFKDYQKRIAIKERNQLISESKKQDEV